MCNGLLKTYLLDLVFLDENLTTLSELESTQN